MRNQHWLVVTISLILTLAANGQESDRRMLWSLGVAAGPLFNQIQGTTTLTQYHNRIGYQAGLAMNYALSSDFSVRAELLSDYRIFGSELYSQGLRETDTSSYVCWSCYYDYEIMYYSHYLTFPVFIQYTQQGDVAGLNFRLGAYYSLLIGAYYDGYEELFLDPLESKPFELIELNPGLYRDVYTGQVLDVINTYDAGLSLGMGGFYCLNKRTKIEIDITLRMGLAELYENPLMPKILQRHYTVRLGIIRELRY